MITMVPPLHSVTSMCLLMLGDDQRSLHHFARFTSVQPQLYVSGSRFTQMCKKNRVAPGSANTLAPQLLAKLCPQILAQQLVPQIVAQLLAHRLNAATTYLADIKRQYADHDNHLSMVGDVLESLVNLSPEGEAGRRR